MRWYDQAEGQTPVDRDEAQGLRIDVTTRAELDEAEQLNIVLGLRWAASRRRLEDRLMTPTGLCALHRQLFGQVWDWAGSFRQTEKNIGVAPYNIPSELEKACGDMRYWTIEGAWDPHEAAIRIHHRLVKIHPFTNGNGRHARIVVDLLIARRRRAPLAWPNDRPAYIAALREADQRRHQPLLALLSPNTAH